MNTREIKTILLGDPHLQKISLIDVCARDQLPTYFDPTKTVGFIVNTDKQTDRGSHWVALYIDSFGQCTYFDSFGFGPLYSEIVNFILRNSTKPLIYNSRMLQDVGSTSCGLYAIYFLLMKARGRSLAQIVQRFLATNQQYKNDRIIKKVIQEYLIKRHL